MKLSALVYFTFKALRFILLMYKPLKFYKNTPKLFQNYILTPVILYLSPCLS
jgi:hypothetical protein